MKSIKFAAGLAAGLLFASAASASVTLNYEAAGVQTTSASVAGKQVATFDDVNGYIGGGTNIFSGQAISGTIAQGGFITTGANVYGGADGIGRYATVQTTTSILLSSAVTYAGLWASAIDGDFSTTAGNTIALYSGNTLLGSYALKTALPGAPNSYYGNPNAAWLGQDSWEPYAFFNLTSTTAFDRIDLIENGGGGFELDNITIGQSGHAGGGDASTGAVPETSTWAMMMIGFGAMGALMRGHRRARAFA